MNNDGRWSRFVDTGDDDHRNVSQRDHDRLMFSFSLQRLASVTQIASTTDSHVFHNRLTHTLEMSQLGRRLSQKILSENETLLERVGASVDPNIVEAACLAHDLGHPPFGHEGESALDECIIAAGDSDGFEANAQSFRVVSVLEPYRPTLQGLNLTRATLKGIVKYPWFRKHGMKKFGWYQSATELVDWVWESKLPSDVSTEARIMDVADDITYAAHDLADFIRARLIPFHCLTAASEERVVVLDNYRRECGEFDEKGLLQFLKDFDKIGGEYFGSWNQRARVRDFSSALIKYFRDSLRVNDLDGVIDISIPGPAKEHLTFLKFVSKYYVHNHRQVLMQRSGFRRIVSTLFEALLDGLEGGNYRMIGLDRERFECFTEAGVGSARLVSDFISSLGDEEAIKCFRRVAGVDCSTILGQSEG